MHSFAHACCSTLCDWLCEQPQLFTCHWLYYNTYLTHPLARNLVAPCTDRIHALELPEVVDMLAAGKREDLLQVEQLGIEMRAGNVFAGFSESPIT